jgi:hypothetical protein
MKHNFISGYDASLGHVTFCNRCGHHKDSARGDCLFNPWSPTLKVFLEWFESRLKWKKNFKTSAARIKRLERELVVAKCDHRRLEQITDKLEKVTLYEGNPIRRRRTIGRRDEWENPVTRDYAYIFLNVHNKTTWGVSGIDASFLPGKQVSFGSKHTKAKAISIAKRWVALREVPERDYSK